MKAYREYLDKVLLLNEDITDNENFNKWFGDSKVVDKSGNPLVVYHGTNKSFSVFKKGKGGMSLDRDTKGAIFFTNDPESADFYTWGKYSHQKTDGANLKPVYLKITNPLIIDGAGGWKNPDLITKWIGWAKEDNNDGIIIKRINDAPIGKYSDMYVVFSPKQIKSATGNNGEFNPNSNNINEDITLDREKKTASIDYKKNDSGISTRMGKDKNFTPFKTSGKMFGKDIVISGYSSKLLDNEEIEPKDLRNIVYNIIKGKNIEYSLSSEEIEYFVKRTIIYLNRFFNKNNISFDIILLPKSSSSLNKKMAEEFRRRFPYDINLYSDEITKSNPEDLQIVGNPPDVIRKALERFMNRWKSDGSFEIKKLPPSFRQYVSNISKIDEKIFKKVEGKNVLIIDDVLTSGITIGDIIRQLRLKSNPNIIYGVTLFKN